MILNIKNILFSPSRFLLNQLKNNKSLLSLLKYSTLSECTTKFEVSTFTKGEVTFFHEVINGTNKKHLKVGYYYYFRIQRINGSIDKSLISNFLQQLKPGTAYVLLPLLDSMSTEAINSPIISLSRQFLVTRDSNPLTIRGFLFQQIQLALENYGIKDSEALGDIILKYRPVSMNQQQVNLIKGLPLTNSNVKPLIQVSQRDYLKIKSPFFNGTVIPLTMDLSEYGTPLTKLISLYYFVKFNLDESGALFQKDGYIIYIKEEIENGSLIQTGVVLKDQVVVSRFRSIGHFNSNSLNDFIREFENHKFVIKNHIITYFDKGFVNSFIKPTKINKKFNKNIITYDIETYQKGDRFIPYSCGWSDGKFTQTYYLTDFSSHYEMLKISLLELMQSFPNAKVYVHNLSNFDYILLTKVLFENFEVKPLFRDNKLIKLTLNLKGHTKNVITFYDSYLILPSSLRTLADKYKVPTQKGFFPYKFVNEDNLEYVGLIPDISYFGEIIQEEYDNLFSYSWSLRLETHRYLELDLISLHQIVMKFAEDIHSNEQIDVTTLPTNSSVAFKIFRTNYLNDNVLPIVKGNAHDEMRNAYYGGVVEVFKNEGDNLFLYDVNSLYPFSMLNPMPTGNMSFSTDTNLQNYFGMVYVSVNTANFDVKYSNYPLLPVRIEDRMYNPLGTWTGWYFSEEVKFAESLGYQIDVHYGYKFERTLDVFTKFVNKYYDIKSGKSDMSMDRTTAKLLLNSLYGRLGMRQHNENVVIVNHTEAESILAKYVVKEQYSLTDDLELLRYVNQPILGFKELYGDDEYFNFILNCDARNISTDQSLPSAIAITAYSRMHMFKTIYQLIDLGINVLYMDTDSIVTDQPIPDDLVGQNIGLFKLEHAISKGYFIAPKLYGLLTKDGKTIVKAKSIGSHITFHDFTVLMLNNTLVKSQERWFKDPSNANINIRNVKITINPGSLKRISVIKDGRLQYTLPLNVKDRSITEK